MNKPFRIGVVGGMGPMPGVLFQQLLIESTKAQKDQEHYQVVCFTNPQIPDRTTSLREDDGIRYVEGIKESLELLERTDVDLAIITCNTAHARFHQIQSATKIPIIHLIESTLDYIKKSSPEARKIGLLATDGTIQSKLFQKTRPEYGFEFFAPNESDQKKIMEIIYGIKAGEIHKDALRKEIERISLALRGTGAEKIILGCTELSLLYKKEKDLGDIFIEPLRIAAKRLAQIAEERQNRL